MGRGERLGEVGDVHLFAVERGRGERAGIGRGRQVGVLADQDLDVGAEPFVDGPPDHLGERGSLAEVAGEDRIAAAQIGAHVAVTLLGRPLSIRLGGMTANGFSLDQGRIRSLSFHRAASGPLDGAVELRTARMPRAQGPGSGCLDEIV